MKHKPIELLMRLPGDLADQALAEALPSADPRTRAEVVQLLLERRETPGLIGLVRYYDGLGGEQQNLILSQLADLESALRAVAATEDPDARANVVAIIGRTGAFQLAYLLAGMLRVTDSRLTRAAAAELLRMSRRQIASAHDTSPESRRQRAFVLNAVIDACACFHQHRRRDILLGALCFMPNRDKRLARVTLDRRATAYPALCATVAQADHPVACRAMLPLSSVEEMADSVVRGLSHPRSGDNLGLILRFAHLLVAPAVRQAVRHVKRAGHLLPTQQRLSQMDLAAARRVPNWIATLSISAETRVAGLAMAAAHGDSLTRLSALRQLIAERGGEADDIVATLCFDHEAAIARLAMRHLIRRRWPGLGRLVVQLMASKHVAVREMAERQLGPVGFHRYWANWPTMTPATRLTAGRALMKIDPAFSRQLDRKLAAESADDRLQAVMMVRHLQQVSYHEKSLLQLVEDIDPRVASAAVGALGRLGESDRAAGAVRSALRHPDDRVRSNAVESLAMMRRAGEVREDLSEMAGGQGNRSRATAIRVLMQLPAGEAVEHLERMLGDEDDRHRISALWVVERLGLASLIERVAKLATDDSDPAVRRRAGRVVRDIASSQLRNHSEAG
jgi:hypothetical protein